LDSLDCFSKLTRLTKNVDPKPKDLFDTSTPDKIQETIEVEAAAKIGVSSNKPVKLSLLHKLAPGWKDLGTKTIKIDIVYDPNTKNSTNDLQISIQPNKMFSVLLPAASNYSIYDKIESDGVKLNMLARLNYHEVITELPETLPFPLYWLQSFPLEVYRNARWMSLPAADTPEYVMTIQCSVSSHEEFISP